MTGGVNGHRQARFTAQRRTNLGGMKMGGIERRVRIRARQLAAWRGGLEAPDRDSHIRMPRSPTHALPQHVPGSTLTVSDGMRQPLLRRNWTRRGV